MNNKKILKMITIFPVMESIGHRGMQLFVDTGVPVDGALVNRLASEVLMDTIRTMLGERPPGAMGQGQEVAPGQPGDQQWHEVPEELEPQVSLIRFKRFCC